MTFSNPDPREFEISPLGAAIVEALPNRRRVKDIEREFKKSGRCPVSAIFKTQDEIDSYYQRETK